MKELAKYFDHYTINARFKPAFFSILPAVITVFAWLPVSKTIIGSTLTILISFGVMTFISSLISNLGNKVQEKLFSQWGGAPTTIIMRHSDDTLDKHTTSRYHQWLNTKINNIEMPNIEDEKTNPDDAEHKYRSATNYLREYSRNKKKYPTVYNDNVSYGFSRNLLAIKKFGLFITLVSVLINSYLIKPVFTIDNITLEYILNSEYILGVGSLSVSVVFLLVFLFLINEGFVKQRAFRYAKSLFEVCEMN